MTRAIEEHRYRDVATIAVMTERLWNAVDFSTRSTNPQRQDETAQLADPALPLKAPERTRSQSNTAPSAMSHRGTATHEYPRFLRDGPDLIKVGWSRKRGAEYLQRSPKQTALALSSVLTELGTRRNHIAMAEILATMKERDERTPTYQIYAAHAWLKSFAAVAGNGRTGYRIDQTRLSNQHMEEMWRLLPEPDPKPNQSMKQEKIDAK